MQVLKAVPIFLLLGAVYAQSKNAVLQNKATQGESTATCLADYLQLSMGSTYEMEHYPVTICYSGREHVDNKDDGFYTSLFQVECGGASVHCFGLGKTNTWVGYAGDGPDHFVIHNSKPDLCHKSLVGRVVRVQCEEKP